MAATAEVARIAEREGRRATIILVALLLALLAIVLLAAGYGALAIAPLQAVAILADPLGIAVPWPFEPAQEMVLQAIRLPRICLGLLAGGALAVAGAALQGLFRNPLADPALIGVSNGAALSAAATIVFGSALTAMLPSALAGYVLPLAAFGGALSAALVVYRVASRDGRTEVATMLLAGVALNAIAAAGIGVLVFLSDDQQLRDLSFWLLGSLGGATWDRLLPAAAFIALPTVALAMMARPLNALLLGEREALHLGFEVDRFKRRVIVLVALAVGASVALTGVIGFIGLVAPHLLRLTIGPDHRALLPGAVLLGAGLLVLADLLARTVVLPAELPVGVLTSCVGGPFFLWLLIRRRGQGMW